MAKRICFVPKPVGCPIYAEIEIEFDYFPGFAVSQKQKSINSMHSSALRIDAVRKVLEISTRSTVPLGVDLSAFKLKSLDQFSGKEYSLENVFQASKMFEKDGPFRDLLDVRPGDAKRDSRLKSSGELIGFKYNDTLWEKEPKTLFYDWIYISALCRNVRLSKEILEFDAFTDIEFNQKKSINCQARSAAIYVSLVKRGKLKVALSNKEEFKKIYCSSKKDGTQVSMFGM